MWVEKEYYWDPKKMGRQKTNAEFADDVHSFLRDYPVKSIYLDPSAEAFQLELRRKGMHAVHANNRVEDGIQIVTSEMKKGTVVVCEECVNTIREIQGYVWDTKQAAKGYDEPLKQNDHAVDALRYAIASHKVSTFDADAHYRKQEEQMRQRMHPGGYGGR